MKAGSASVDALLRWLARGASMASGRLMPKSIWLISVCSTVVMIVEPPGEPTASTARPLRSTIIGLIELRGRLFGATEFAVPVGKLKSVSSLLSRKPRPGTVMPEPAICSIVFV